jgi:predicted dehydrogenase
MTHLKRRKFMKYATTSGLGIALSNTTILGSSLNYPDNVRIGIIGMDTSHSVAFTEYINGHDNGFEVIAAYTTVSKDIPASYDRVDKFTQQLKDLGIRIVDSINQLLEQVDCILLETNDGRLHLEQAEEVFQSGKPVFIDKPVAASLEDAVSIYEAAKKHNVVTFSTSGTRFMAQAQKVRNGSIGKVLGADTFSPVKYVPSHSDLYWYGMHGVEHLFTVMRTGCTRVQRTKTDTCDTVVGEWDNGRIGTFRGIVDGSGGHGGHGGQAFGTEEIAYLGRWEGYEPLVDAVLHYFRTNEVPVEPAETLEIYAFMEAAKVSSERNGEWVTLESVLKEARN